MATLSLNLIIVNPAFAQSIPKPSVPEFTVKFSGTFSIPLTGYSLPSANITIKNNPLPLILTNMSTKLIYITLFIGKKIPLVLGNKMNYH
ncbi:MAG TPA: hypothetical protein VLU95_01225 [Candidatus Acidoferrum sp.]|nr:hypothetical protein [Candidatus Acidoferrum sp.]